jgi:alpha-L-fucosidase
MKFQTSASMNKIRLILSITLLSFVTLHIKGQNNFSVKTADTIRARQIADMQFGMFICWSFSTFSGQEWTPTEGKDASYFKATGCNTDQWCQVAKDAGMHYILFLTKHHDGFCLWDTKTTEKKVTNSPLGIDVLARLRKSCDKYGIKLALYFSEGDWTFPGAVYSTNGGLNPEIKKAQLKEMLTGYGPIEYIWFDHAQGDGGLSHAETDQWVAQFQPDCLPGYNHGTPAGRIRLGEMGSPSALDDFSGAGYNKGSAGYKGYIAAEFTYPILPDHKGGAMWFYSLPEHDNLCLPAERIYRDYAGAVKFRNIFSLDVGPDYKGDIRAIDVKTLNQVGAMIRGKVGIPVPLAGTASASSIWFQPGYEAGKASDNNFSTRWGAVNDSRSGWLEITLDSEMHVSGALIDEGGFSRILKFEIQAQLGNKWKTIATGTSVGPYRKIEFPKPVKAQRFRLNITEANEVPTIAEFQLF